MSRRTAEGRARGGPAEIGRGALLADAPVPFLHTCLETAAVSREDPLLGVHPPFLLAATPETDPDFSRPFFAFFILITCIVLRLCVYAFIRISACALAQSRGESSFTFFSFFWGAVVRFVLARSKREVIDVERASRRG